MWKTPINFVIWLIQTKDCLIVWFPHIRFHNGRVEIKIVWIGVVDIFRMKTKKNCHTNIQICCISPRKKIQEKLYDFGLGWFDECLHWILYRSCNETLKWMIFYISPIPYRPKDGRNYQWNKYFFKLLPEQSFVFFQFTF